MSANHQVYVIRCEDDDRQYVGLSHTPEARWEQHKSTAKAGSEKPLYAAMRVFGIEKFSMTVVAEFPSRHDAQNHERMMIDSLIKEGKPPYNLQILPIKPEPPLSEPDASDKDRRTKIIQLAFTPAEKDEVSKIADYRGFPLSTWIRYIIFLEVCRIKEKEAAQ